MTVKRILCAQGGFDAVDVKSIKEYGDTPVLAETELVFQSNDEAKKRRIKRYLKAHPKTIVES